MNDRAYTLVYSAVLGVACAVLLTGVGQLTKKYRDANANAEKYRNVLHVLGVPFSPKGSASELVRLFNQSVRQETLDGRPFYRYIDGASGEVKSVAVEFRGMGLWGPIRGLLALEPDMKTIRSVSFYEQEETPGLGGEIGSEWFQTQFEGKKVAGTDGTPGIRILKGKGAATEQNEVDGITGATLTCAKVEGILNEVIRTLNKE